MDILIYGTVNSVVFALIAVGFTLVYGVSRVPNFAHGALYILTGYIAWTFLNTLGINYGLAIIIALVIVAVIGAAIYQFLLIRVRGMPDSEIIASFAIGLAIMEGLRWGGFIGQAYIIPVFIEGAVEIAGVPIDFQRLIIIGGGLAVVAFLWLFTHYTKVGLSLRAIAQDERAAMMLGIDSDLTAVIALALGSALAGVAAIAILPLGNITVETGYNVLIYAIAVCIIGGLGSWPGAVMGAFVLGFAQILTVAYIAPQWTMVVVFLAIILTLILRPSGLFGRQKELEERV
ncbi:MAG: branched-chain amino acid ABC transporter permease [Dehalococcoidia bacterium]|nr:branched-chain amino acid ABC transporter permease [Dehalococcoidia bacterium]